MAVNPFQVLPLYTLEQVQLHYTHHAGELPPHVFTIANSCYFNMKRNKRDQCCIIRWGQAPCPGQGGGATQHHLYRRERLRFLTFLQAHVRKGSHDPAAPSPTARELPPTPKSPPKVSFLQNLLFHCLTSA